MSPIKPGLPQIRIPATYMRGGTSKGVFFRLEDMPEPTRVPGIARDKLFQRVIGSPDPYAAHIDGMGGATSSTSKCVIVSPSTQPGHDVDYLYGQIAIDTGFVDWSSNCGNLSTAAGAFAIHAGYVDPARAEQGIVTVRIWQANIGKTIITHVPVTDGPNGLEVQETGDFELDGVTFPAAEIVLEIAVGQPGVCYGRLATQILNLPKPSACRLPQPCVHGDVHSADKERGHGRYPAYVPAAPV